VLFIEVKRFSKIPSIKNPKAFSGGASIFLKYAHTTFFPVESLIFTLE